MARRSKQVPKSASVRRKKGIYSFIDTDTYIEKKKDNGSIIDCS